MDARSRGRYSAAAKARAARPARKARPRALGFTTWSRAARGPGRRPASPLPSRHNTFDFALRGLACFPRPQTARATALLRPPALMAITCRSAFRLAGLDVHRGLRRSTGFPPRASAFRAWTQNIFFSPGRPRRRTVDPRRSAWFRGSGADVDVRSACLLIVQLVRESFAPGRFPRPSRRVRMRALRARVAPCG